MQNDPDLPPNLPPGLPPSSPTAQESQAARSAVDKNESQAARSAVDKNESQAARSAVDNNEPPPAQYPPQYYVQPVPREQQVRQWAMLLHLASLLGLAVPFGGLIGVLLVWQIKKVEFPELDAHGKEAMNFQLSMMIYAVVSFILIFFIIGIFLLFVLGLVWLILPIISAVQANDGKLWSYPLCIPFFK
jgi:uncharacterized protein